ncbi:hypothetical protein PDM28_02375 [Stenotrophomonas aracearum]|uniref:Uncharacterized protein n=1 Tax=Stenotrophomonas aracearum TaxID=3003272 RepID=A0ABY9YE93_9GAMM|nr:hypothetical protein [Stenotrophomonas sp. A5588]WNH49198.1 hypothetical protein PDM28_02375 [Stenotrophomonas sp. A5588]
MTDPASRLRQEIALGEFLASLEGKLVRVTQTLSSRSGADVAKRSATQVRFRFRVKTSFLAMTGGRHFTLYGDDGDTAYAFNPAFLSDFAHSGDGATITESYGSDAERGTTLEVLPDAM